MSKGFLESLISDLVMHAVIESNKDAKGRPDPYRAAGMFYGVKGDLSSSDLCDLGTLLGSQGAFDDQDDDH